MDREALRRQRDAYRERAVECAREALAGEPGSPAQQRACRDGLFCSEQAEAIYRAICEASADN